MTRSELVAGCDVLAKPHVALRHDSTKRRENFCLLQFQIDGLQGCLRAEHVTALPLHFILACGDFIAGVVIGFLRVDAFLVHGLCASHVSLANLKFGLPVLQVGLQALYLVVRGTTIGFELPGIEPNKNLIFLNYRIDVDWQSYDYSRTLSHNIELLFNCYRTGRDDVVRSRESIARTEDS